MSGAAQDVDKKPAEQSAHINLMVKGQDGNEVSFRNKRSTQLRKLMNAYCDRQSIDINSIAFLFDGRRLRAEQTPDELEMEDGDEIDAMLHQTGAGLPFSPPRRNPFSFDDLVATLPGRRPQIVKILNLLGPSDSPALPILIYGGPSTDKTTSVLRIFHHLRRTFVYVSCLSCHSPQILFESVLNQLLHQRRDRENGYSSAKCCERASDFVNLLKDALVQAFGALRCGKERSHLKKCQKGYGDSERIYLVFDNVELVRSWDKSSEILPLLFRLYDMLKMPDVGVIYISSMTPDSFYSMTGSMEPISVYFPDYTVDDLQRILVRNQENPMLYSCFLSAVLKAFYRVTRRVDELATAFKPLFEKYCEPLSDATLLPNESMKRRLFDHLQPHLAASLNETLNVPLWSSSGVKKEGSFIKKGNIRKVGGKDVSNELDFHMPVSAKTFLFLHFSLQETLLHLMQHCLILLEDPTIVSASGRAPKHQWT